MEGLGCRDAVREKFMEAFESKREREGRRMERRGPMRGAQVDNELSIRSAPLRSSLFICQQMRGEQQEAKKNTFNCLTTERTDKYLVLRVGLLGGDKTA